MLSGELEHTINSSKIIICRAGYLFILDLVLLNKEAILIPAKHQNEQEYLVKHFH
jgi:UDP-N-acetylglucosamine:LPS N-acetylglucosamine transferase